MNDRMKAIRDKYGVSVDDLNKMDMDEFDYERAQESAIKSYIRGHLVDICDINGNVDIYQVAENIFNYAKIYKNTESLQKAILGEIVGIKKDHISRGQLVSISHKITTKLLS